MDAAGADVELWKKTVVGHGCAVASQLTAWCRVQPACCLYTCLAVNERPVGWRWFVRGVSCRLVRASVFHPTPALRPVTLRMFTKQLFSCPVELRYPATPHLLQLRILTNLWDMALLGLSGALFLHIELHLICNSVTAAVVGVVWGVREGNAFLWDVRVGSEVLGVGWRV